MNAIELLRTRHRRLFVLLDRIDGTEGAAQASAVVAFGASLVADTLLEQELLCPACEERGIGDDVSAIHRELVLEALEDATRACHGERFAFKVMALRDALVGHVSHLEDIVFPLVEGAYRPAELRELAMRMHGRLAQLTVGSSYREVLRADARATRPIRGGHAVTLSGLG